MHEAERLSLEQIRAFLDASEEVVFAASNRQELYEWVSRVLVGQQYQSLGRPGKGLVRRCVEKMTGQGFPRSG